jgi:hypothetical protein
MTAPDCPHVDDAELHRILEEWLKTLPECDRLLMLNLMAYLQARVHDRKPGCKTWFGPDASLELIAALMLRGWL